MKLNNRSKSIKPKVKKLKGRIGGQPLSPWTDEVKIKVATTWLTIGSFAKTAAICEVPFDTIKSWSKQQWWKDLVSDIRSESDLELDAKLSKIIDKTLTQLEDRLDNGEVVVNRKTGEVMRVPMRSRDIHRAASDFIDKRETIRDKPVKQEQQEAVQDRLLKLAQTFAEFALHKKKPRTIEGEVIDAVYEERETGLQEGIREIPGPAISNQEQVSQESSPS